VQAEDEGLMRFHCPACGVGFMLVGLVLWHQVPVYPLCLPDAASMVFGTLLVMLVLPQRRSS
jgi:hypothetical protein